MPYLNKRITSLCERTKAYQDIYVNKDVYTKKEKKITRNASPLGVTLTSALRPRMQFINKSNVEYISLMSMVNTSVNEWTTSKSQLITTNLSVYFPAITAHHLKL